MVADSVEIITVSAEEEYARQISLRSVHGKYLIRLLEKHSDPRAKLIGAHGTSFILTFRPSAKPLDVVRTLRKWIILPRCKVLAAADDMEPEAIGFNSLKEALEDYFNKADARQLKLFLPERVECREHSTDEVTVAFALGYNPHFRDWSFVSIPTEHQFAGEEEWSPVATCIEGVAVEFASPGFLSGGVFAIANARGIDAPKTNVARSSIEAGRDTEEHTRKIYGILIENVAAETRRLQSEEGFSLAWAAEQVSFLVDPIADARGRLTHPKIHAEELAKIPAFLIETATGRTLNSLTDLRSIGSFWTVESQLMRSVEQFIKEAKAELTAQQLIAVGQTSAAPLPNGAILANNQTSFVRNLIDDNFEISQIVAHVSERRLDACWKPRANI